MVLVAGAPGMEFRLSCTQPTGPTPSLLAVRVVVALEPQAQATLASAALLRASAALLRVVVSVALGEAARLLVALGEAAHLAVEPA